MIPRVKLKTAPAEQVVTVAELKTFLKVDGSDEDAFLLSLIKSAERRIEAETEIKFITQTWEIYFDCFPFERRKDIWWDGVREGAIQNLFVSQETLKLPFGPLSTLNSFNYYLESNAEQTVESDSYYVDTVSKRGRIALKTGYAWPTSILRPMNGVKIDADFGFGDAEDVPEEIKNAVLNFCAILYEHRGDELPEIPASVLMMLLDYMEYRI